MPVRTLTPAEIPDLTPINVSDEQGVTAGERFVVKNLTASPESARGYLETRGYQVRKYGDGWNFAVRKSDGEPWKVVDPRGMDAWDLTDLLGDLGVGAFTTGATTLGAGMGAVGGPAGVVAGGVAGGGAGGALAEMGRQGLGKLAGVPDNVDTGQIAMSGVLGAAFPAVGGAIGGAGRGVASMAKGQFGKDAAQALYGLGAVVAGTGNLGTAMPRSEVLAARARIGKSELRSVESVAKRLNTVVNRIWNKGKAHIAELDEAERLAGLAETKGVKVDLRQAVEALDRYTPESVQAMKTTTKQASTITKAATTREASSMVGSTVERRGVRTNLLEEPPTQTPFATQTGETRTGALSGSGESTVTRDVTTTRTAPTIEEQLSQDAAELAISEPELPKAIQSVIGRIKTFLGDQDLSAVSPVTATKIKRQVQKIGFSKGAYENVPVGDAFTRLMATFGHDIRTATVNSMDAAGFHDYANVLDIGARRFRILKDMYEVAGRDPDQALSYVRGVYGGNFRAGALHDFEKNMGFKAGGLSKAVEEARIGEVVFGPGKRGRASLLPRVSAVGTLLGTTFVANQLGIDIGPLGALAGVLMASPRGVLAMARLGQKVGGQAGIMRLPASQGAAFVKEAVKILSLSAAQGSGRRVLSEDSQGRRRAVFVGD